MTAPCYAKQQSGVVQSFIYPRGCSMIYFPDRDDYRRDLINQFILRRKELGLSQEDIDIRIGLSERCVSRWECGMRTVGSTFLLYCWAEALDAKLTLVPNVKVCPYEN